MSDFTEETENTEESYNEDLKLGDASLYIVATPIGNIGDITYRAIEILKSVDLIAAEDTRHSYTLLSRLGIKNELISFHEYSDKAKIELLISKMLDGKKIALISDAGMPGISDPGIPLVKACIENNIKVTAVPGASAVVTALPISGMDSRRFVFEGFIPRDKTRKDVINDIIDEKRTVVFYESPHHLVRTLEELNALIPDRKIAVLRELTKLYEEKLLLTVSEAFEHFNINTPRGEFVLILEGKTVEKKSYTDDELRDIALKYIESGLSKRDATEKLVSEFGIAKNLAKKIVMGL